MPTWLLDRQPNVDRRGKLCFTYRRPKRPTGGPFPPGTQQRAIQTLRIARHKNLTILFVSQNSSNLEINTLRQADFLVLKRSSLLQKNFERKIVAKIYGEHSDKFENYKAVKGLALIYAEDFVGFVENDLPSFWSSKVSKSFL